MANEGAEASDKDPGALAGANGVTNNLDDNQITIPDLPQGTLLTKARCLACAGMPVNPLYRNKKPASPHGHLDATTDAAGVERLFRSPGVALVSVPTGDRTGIAVLDLDTTRHDEAKKWLEEHRSQIPPTRCHRSRSGGIHLLFQHVPGLRCSAGRLALGVDVKADGGAIIWWPAMGYPVLDWSPLAVWPDWLTAKLQPASRVTMANAPSVRITDAYLRTATERAAMAVFRAEAGTRNAVFNAQLWSVLRFVQSGRIDIQTVTTLLAHAALAAGLTRAEVLATLRSAIRARGIS